MNKLSKKLNKKFKAIIFDWDGTAVKNRNVPVDDLLPRLETLLEKNVKLIIITGTNFDNVDVQFCQKVKPELKKNLYVCVNRGSEVYGFNKNGKIEVLHKRTATPEENKVMDEISGWIVDLLRREYDLHTRVVYNRYNRRKLDLIPEWEKPGKDEIDKLLEKVEDKLKKHKIEGGIQQIIDMVYNKAAESGIDLKITTDVKHIEYGLTNKEASIDYAINEICEKYNISNEEIIILGDEFGHIGGFEGSDYKMYSDIAKGALYVSVGIEPNGVPEGVYHYGKGPGGFEEIMDIIIENL